MPGLRRRDSASCPQRPQFKYYLDLSLESDRSICNTTWQRNCLNPGSGVNVWFLSLPQQPCQGPAPLTLSPHSWLSPCTVLPELAEARLLLVPLLESASYNLSPYSICSPECLSVAIAEPPRCCLPEFIGSIHDLASHKTSFIWAMSVLLLK